LFFLVPEEVLRYFDKRIEEHLNASLADRTSLTYNSQCNQFLMFAFWTCGAKPFLPASDTLLCQYLEWQIGSVDPKNLGGYLSAIRNLHLSLGLPWVELRDRHIVRWVIKGMRGLIGTPRKQKLAMTPELLVRMRLCGKIRWCDPRMKVIWAAMLLAFFTMSRKDNFSVDKIDAFNPRKHLTRSDVKVLKSGVHCTFRRSKTNQFGSRVHQVFALASPGTILDPKAAVEEAFAVAPRARPSDPAFLLPSANGLAPLTHFVFVGSVKHCVQQVGLDPSGYSGHSFRRGGATLAHRLGIDPLLIKRMGDWSSDAYMDYVDPHTPEGLVSLPVAMTSLCAQLG